LEGEYFGSRSWQRPGAAYVLLRGAAQRGRDSFYAAGTAACIITVAILAFINVGITGEAFQPSSWGLGSCNQKAVSHHNPAEPSNEALT
jgi:hypothetical protein